MSLSRIVRPWSKQRPDPTRVVPCSVGQFLLTLIPDKVLASKTPPKLAPGAISDGMKLLKQYVVDYHHSCPNTKIVIIGYSSGAVIAMNDFCYGGSGVGTPQLNPAIAGSYGKTLSQASYRSRRKRLLTHLCSHRWRCLRRGDIHP